MSQRQIGPNPNTTPHGGTPLWDAARKGKTAAAAKVRRLQAQGTWSPETAAELIADLDQVIAEAGQDTVEQYRAISQRAYFIAASA
jgi:hypothetical protein